MEWRIIGHWLYRFFTHCSVVTIELWAGTCFGCFTGWFCFMIFHGTTSATACKQLYTTLENDGKTRSSVHSMSAEKYEETLGTDWPVPCRYLTWLQALAHLKWITSKGSCYPVAAQTDIRVYRMVRKTSYSVRCIQGTKLRNTKEEAGSILNPVSTCCWCDT